jgi:pimeloyl-ACP methyl ester carboxylesterase
VAVGERERVAVDGDLPDDVRRSQHIFHHVRGNAWSDNAGMRVTVDDVRLYFDVEGCGLTTRGEKMVAKPVLVLLHGGPGADHSLFKPEFSAMADAAQVIYLDQRGSGRSDHGDPEKWTWRRWADDVAEFCQALGIEAPVLVGTSSGARVAVECAARHPGLAVGLVLDSALFETTSLEDSLQVFERRGGARAREAAAQFLGGDFGPEAGAAWARYCLPLYGSTPDGDMAARGARAIINRDVVARFRRDECGPNKITAADIDAASCPVLILSGEDDPMTPAGSARRLAASVQRPVELHVFAGVGHGVFRQAPAQAFALLRAFLTEDQGESEG